MINKDQVKGRIEQAKGAVKSTIGEAVGNTQMHVEGEAEKMAGKVQASYGDAKQKAENLTKK